MALLVPAEYKVVKPKQVEPRCKVCLDRGTLGPAWECWSEALAYTKPCDCEAGDDMIKLVKGMTEPTRMRADHPVPKYRNKLVYAELRHHPTEWQAQAWGVPWEWVRER